MKYPKYGDWCKKNVIETIRKQRIYEEKKYLEDFIFNLNSDLYSSGVYDYDIDTLLWIINGDDPDDLSKTLFSAVQHGFAEKYFQMAQEINPEMDMNTLRRNDSDCTDLMYRVLENEITIDELKDAVMYAFEYGTEEVEGAKIPYARTNIFSIVKTIKSRLIRIEGIHINYLNPDAGSEDVPVDKFTDYLFHLSRSGIFADTINWRYVDLFDSGKFLIEGDISHNNGSELNVIVVTKNKPDKEKVVKILRESEE